MLVEEISLAEQYRGSDLVTFVFKCIFRSSSVLNWIQLSRLFFLCLTELLTRGKLKISPSVIRFCYRDSCDDVTVFALWSSAECSIVEMLPGNKPVDSLFCIDCLPPRRPEMASFMSSFCTLSSFKEERKENEMNTPPAPS